VRGKLRVGEEVLSQAELAQLFQAVDGACHASSLFSVFMPL
jgi:hypothetical protein